MATLADDRASGTWSRAHADLLAQDEIDAGYRTGPDERVPGSIVRTTPRNWGSYSDCFQTAAPSSAGNATALGVRRVRGG